MQFLPGGNASGTYEEANKDDNKEKNRYPNILPCERTFCSVGTEAPFDSELAASCMRAHVLRFFLFCQFDCSQTVSAALFIYSNTLAAACQLHFLSRPSSPLLICLFLCLFRRRRLFLPTKRQLLNFSHTFVVPSLGEHSSLVLLLSVQSYASHLTEQSKSRVGYLLSQKVKGPASVLPACFPAATR